MIMIIAFIVRKLPYTVRSGSAFLQQMDVSVEEASISLGVSPMKTFGKCNRKTDGARRSLRRDPQLDYLYQ